MNNRIKKDVDDLIVHLVSSKVWGGGEQYVLDIAKDLLLRGKRCKVYCRTDYVEKIFRADKVPTHHIPLLGFFDFVSPLVLAIRLCKEKHVCVHVHNFKDAFTAAILKYMIPIRIVMTRHLVKPGKKNLIYKFIYKKIDYLIFVSRLAQEAFSKGCPDFPRNKQLVIYNSRPSEELIESKNLRNKLGIGEGEIIGMFHGRITSEKGLKVLIEALGKIRNLDFRMLIVGRGDKKYTKKIQEFAKRKGVADNILFLGFRRDISELISICDFGVLPSICQESSSLSCMEFMKSGKTLITTNNGAQREYLRDGHDAFLVEPNDVNALADKMEILIKEPKLRLSMGANALQSFQQKLNFDKFIADITTIYRE